MNALEQFEKLSRGVVEIIPAYSLLNLLEISEKSNKPLNIKLGIDPTSNHIHLGFTVVLRKLRQFQELGHNAILIIGDYTATIGDPSGKNSTRPKLSHEEVLKNAETYLEQCFKILDKDLTKVVYNSSWFNSMKFEDITRLLSKMTVAQMLERLDFKTRYENGSPISLHEFIYPLMQGFDSVMIDADIEIGGTDQKFNVLRGRELQSDSEVCERYSKKVSQGQLGMFLPILLGTCGKEKMSKSLGNLVGISEDPQEMFHKIYNIPDSLVESWFTLLTDIYPEALENKDIISKKQILAWDIVRQYYSLEIANEVLVKESENHSKGISSKSLKEIKWCWEDFRECLMTLGKFKSNTELKNMIKNNGIKVDGVVISGTVLGSKSFVLEIGKNFIVRICE